MVSDLQKKIVELAVADLGQEETAGNSGFKNAAFLKAMQAAGWQKGWAWCAVFVEKIYMDAYRQLPQTMSNETRYKTVRSMISPGAVATYHNAKAIRLTVADPAPGYLVVWRSGTRGAGHIGIVEKVTGNGKMLTIEGNTGRAGEREGTVVMRKVRNTTIGNGSLRLLGFIKPV